MGTELAAIPLAIGDEPRGPLMPGGTRHIVLERRRLQQETRSLNSTLTPDVEISKVRIWDNPDERDASTSDL